MKHRASIKQKVIKVSQKLDADQETIAKKIKFLLDVGQGRSQAIISYNQVLDYLENHSQDEETYSSSGSSQVIKNHRTVMIPTTKGAFTM